MNSITLTPSQHYELIKILESITHSYPQYGIGGAYQMRIDDIIKFDEIKLIGE